MLISSISALVIGTFNHQFNMKDGFKASFDGFNHTMLHQSHISDNAKTLIEQGWNDEHDSNHCNYILWLCFCWYC